MTYPFSSSSDMTAAGNAIPVACSSVNATGSSPASRRRSSSRCCWASAVVIDGLSSSSGLWRLEYFKRAAVTGRFATGGWVAADRCVRRSRVACRGVVATASGEGARLDAEAEEVARIAVGVSGVGAAVQAVKV